jgi:hypothetical protein
MIDMWKWAYIDIDEASYDTLDDKAARLVAEGIPHKYREGKYGSLEIDIQEKTLHKLFMNDIITGYEYDELDIEKVNGITIE